MLLVLLAVGESLEERARGEAVVDSGYTGTSSRLGAHGGPARRESAQESCLLRGCAAQRAPCGGARDRRAARGAVARQGCSGNAPLAGTLARAAAAGACRSYGRLAACRNKTVAAIVHALAPPTAPRIHRRLRPPPPPPPLNSCPACPSSHPPPPGAHASNPLHDAFGTAKAVGDQLGGNITAKANAALNQAATAAFDATNATVAPIKAKVTAIQKAVDDKLAPVAESVLAPVRSVVKQVSDTVQSKVDQAAKLVRGSFCERACSNARVALMCVLWGEGRGER